MINRRNFLYFLGGSALSLLNPSIAYAKETALQASINRLIQEKRRKGLILPSERTAWSIYDFRTRKKLVRINEQRSMQSASMIKPFIATAYLYLNSRNSKKYPYGSKERHLMNTMIINSSNSSTNNLMRRCGGPSKIKYLCERATGASFKQLRVVEYIPQNGRTYRNLASAHDYSKLLYAIFMNKSPKSVEIKRVLSEENRDRIFSGTSLPSYLNIYDKTGSTARCCGDAGIIEVSRKRKNAYTFIAIIDRPTRARNYGSWIRSRGEIIRDVSEISYKYMSRHYSLLDNIG